MIKRIYCCLRAAVLVSAFLCLARPAFSATHTNLIFNVSIAMQTYVQDYAIASSNVFYYRINTGKMNSSHIAAAIAALPRFKDDKLAGAKLLYRVTDLGTNRGAGFILRKGTNDVDVRDFLTLGFPPSYVTVTSKAPGANNTTNAVDYGIISLGLSGPSAGFFDTEGFGIVKSSSVFKGRDLIQSEEFPATISAKVGGSGYAQGSKAIYQGTVMLSGRKVELREGP